MMVPHSPDSRDREHIERVYGERARSIPADRYSAFDPGNLFIMQQREQAVIAALKRQRMHPLAGRRILDVGCGTGGELRNLVRYGAVPSLLCGIDVLEERIAEARTLSPNMHFAEGSARTLPFADNSFDIVSQFTVFTSVLDDELRRAIAREMLRVVKDDGIILWYDLQVSNPQNRNVRGITKQEIRSLFPRCAFDFSKITLAPPLARMIAPYSWLACYLLERLPFLRTHLLASIRKIPEREG